MLITFAATDGISGSKDHDRRTYPSTSRSAPPFFLLHKNRSGSQVLSLHRWWYRGNNKSSHGDTIVGEIYHRSGNNYNFQMRGTAINFTHFKFAWHSSSWQRNENSMHQIGVNCKRVYSLWNNSQWRNKCLQTAFVRVALLTVLTSFLWTFLENVSKNWTQSCIWYSLAVVRGTVTDLNFHFDNITKLSKFWS